MQAKPKKSTKSAKNAKNIERAGRIPFFLNNTMVTYRLERKTLFVGVLVGLGSRSRNSPFEAQLPRRPLLRCDGDGLKTVEVYVMGPGEGVSRVRAAPVRKLESKDQGRTPIP
jgi:ribosomal protein S11